MPESRRRFEPGPLQLDGIRLVYNQGRPDQVVALQRIDLAAEPGEFITVIGSNGAGKSSIVQVVSGSVRPTQGRVRLAGRDITRWPDYRRAALIARVFDDPRVGTAPDLSIEDNLALAMSRGRRRGLRPSLSASRRRMMRDRLAHLGLGLEDRLPDRVGLLSAGQRQSLTMVMAGLAARSCCCSTSTWPHSIRPRPSACSPSRGSSSSRWVARRS